MKPHEKSYAGKDAELAAMLLDPETASAKVQGHFEVCQDCGKELGELKATMALLDAWEIPDPSPYFMTRLGARIEEERQTAPAGWLGRRLAAMRAGFAYGPRMHVRPLTAMALTALLLLGGGTYLDLTNWDQAVVPAQPTAVVHDLQTMQNNAQLLDQLEALSSNTDATNNGN